MNRLNAYKNQKSFEISAFVALAFIYSYNFVPRLDLNLCQIIRENIFNLYGKEVPFSCEVASSQNTLETMFRSFLVVILDTCAMLSGCAAATLTSLPSAILAQACLTLPVC